MDRLQRSHFLHVLTGNVYLSQHEAVSMLRAQLEAERPLDPKASFGADI
jgi:hypothetical protein